MSLDNKVAIITGGARGIGHAITTRYAQEGVRIVIADADEAAGDEVAEEMKEKGAEVDFFHCNTAERLDVRNLLAHTLENFGSVDILVNNAAVMDAVPFLELSEEEFDRVIGVNLKGYFLTGQAAAKQMVQQIEQGKDPGTIINISSINQHFAFAEHAAYAMSKGGVAQLTKSMALALASHQIRVNAIAPGSIATKMLDPVSSSEVARMKLLSRTPLGRIGNPSEIAGIAVFLASNDASYITGETIFADGGRMALNGTVNVEDAV